MGDPTAAAGFSWREVVDVIESKVPFGRVIVPVFGLLLAAVGIVWAVRFLYENAAEPIGRALSQQTLSFEPWSVVASVLLIGIIGLAITQWLLYRHLRSWQRVFLDVLNDRLVTVSERVDSLSDRAATTKSVNDALRDLHGRVSSLEPVPLDVDPKQQEGYQRWFLLKLLGGPRALSLNAEDTPKPGVPNFGGA
jgi:hypothetical protein